MTDLEALAVYHAERDAGAFRHPYLTYQQTVYNVCLRIVGTDADAEDAAQETFLKLAREAGNIKRNLASWLYSCAVHTSLNLLKSRPRVWRRIDNIHLRPSVDLPPR